jgi:heme o synthase
MKTTVLTEALPLAPARWQDFVALTKPRIAVLVLFTVAIGALLARRGAINWEQLVHTLIGTSLVAAGASALNQLLERHSDALMRRTENRPLPGGRLQPLEVLFFGVCLSVAGTAYLAVTLRHPLAAIVAAITALSYVLIYTPLKKRTTLNTLIGAIPGALPPVIGWTAATGRIDREVIILFLIVFLWQVPHFLAIAWIYREDYGRAGLKMLPVVDDVGSMTGRQMVLYCMALVPVSLMPVLFGQTGWVYAVGAVALGLYFLRSTCRFLSAKTPARARRVLHASLIYLPALLALLLVETIRNVL